MKTLKEYILEAKEGKYAIGHFNISNLETLHGIFNAAKKMGLPVIIGVSEGERDFIGVHEAVAVVKSLRDNNLAPSGVGKYPIFINADHTYTFLRVKEAIDAGYDSVIFDGAKLPFDENIKTTKECVEYARATRPDVLIEAELGYIGQSSKILDGVPEGVEMTSVEDAIKYSSQTGLDLFAPAVGNIHGMLKDVPDPRLDIERVGEISKATGLPLVLHGASGNSAEDISAAIKNGVVIVHINTEIRVAYRDAMKKSLVENPDEVAPYKFAKCAVEAVEKLVEEKLKIFSAGKLN